MCKIQSETKPPSGVGKPAALVAAQNQQHAKWLGRLSFMLLCRSDLSTWS